MTNIAIRTLDILFSLTGLLVGLPLLLLITSLGLKDTGSPIFLQTRVGKDRKPFTLIKFRTMKIGTDSVATHLSSPVSVTKLGSFLRRSKLDELPQLINVLLGQMSLVGPRPGLYNQEELTLERLRRGIYEVRPGITGLAQVNNVDMSTPRKLAIYDQKMIKAMSVRLYFWLIFMTVSGKGNGDRLDQS